MRNTQNWIHAETNCRIFLELAEKIRKIHMWSLLKVSVYKILVNWKLRTFGSGGLNSNYFWLELLRREEEIPLFLKVFESINIVKKCITWLKAGLESQLSYKACFSLVYIINIRVKSHPSCEVLIYLLEQDSTFLPLLLQHIINIVFLPIFVGEFTNLSYEHEIPHPLIRNTAWWIFPWEAE